MLKSRCSIILTKTQNFQKSNKKKLICFSKIAKNRKIIYLFFDFSEFTKKPKFPLSFFGLARATHPPFPFLGLSIFTIAHGAAAS